MMDKNNGILDAKELLEKGIIDRDMLEGVAYRTPCENKYSMVVFNIKGFLPRGSGGNIILPREITTLAGLDFDIDKMAIMMKPFDIVKENANDKDIKRFKSVEYDVTKDVTEYKRREKNSMLIDIFKAVLQNKKTAVNILNGGNFDNLRTVADMIIELEGTKESAHGYLNPLTLIDTQQQNSVAANAIGIVANAKGNMLVRQMIKDNVTVREGLIKLNGQAKTKLNGTYISDTKTGSKDKSGAYISRLYTNYLAGVVDAVKDPVLRFFNFTLPTCDSFMLLTGLGYDLNTIALFMNNPKLKSLSKQVNNS